MPSGHERDSEVDAAFLTTLVQARRVLLTGHEHPDGDCIGAQVALFHLLAVLDRQVEICNPDPPIASLDFVRRHTRIRALSVDGPPAQPDLVVLLDCAHLSRLGRLEEFVRSSGARVAVIDHHVGSERGDADVGYVDSTAPATGAMVYRVYSALGEALTLPAAEGVFLSLVADTGWFRYSNTTAEVLEIAARMIRLGVDSSWVHDQMFRRNHTESIDLLSRSLAASKIGLDGRYATTTLDKVQLERAARIGFDTDLVMEPLRSLAGVEVVALLKERFDGTVKLSLRSSGDVDVQAIAVEFGGGGHHKAAGATVTGSLAEVHAAVEARVRAALKALTDGAGSTRSDGGR